VRSLSAKPYKFIETRRNEYLKYLSEGMRRGTAADAVGMTRVAINDYKNKHPEFAHEEEKAELESCEIIEDALFNAASSGNVKAIELWLTRRSKSKWEAVPIQMRLGGADDCKPILVKFIEVEAKKTDDDAAED
jgi:hypothetical protein